jgi:hypothetical protein
MSTGRASMKKSSVLMTTPFHAVNSTSSAKDRGCG